MKRAFTYDNDVLWLNSGTVRDFSLRDVFLHLKVLVKCLYSVSMWKPRVLVETYDDGDSEFTTR